MFVFGGPWRDWPFLGFSIHVCWSVRLLVGTSDCRSVRPSVPPSVPPSVQDVYSTLVCYAHTCSKLGYGMMDWGFNTFGILWYTFGILRDTFVILLRYFLDTFWILFGYFWMLFGYFLDSFCILYILLEYLWDTFGLLLG